MILVCDTFCLKEEIDLLTYLLRILCQNYVRTQNPHTYYLISYISKKVPGLI